MKENINNFIVNDEDLNVDQLLDETLTLFGENSTTISMFDMLHNMRQIDDSTYAHSVNVALICRLIGKWKNFSEKDMDTLTSVVCCTISGNPKFQMRSLESPESLQIPNTKRSKTSGDRLQSGQKP